MSQSLSRAVNGNLSNLNWSQGMAQVNGVQLAYEQAGPERGEPLLLVMGLSWQLIHWPESLCADLVARGFRVVRFDNRDIGLSSSVDRGIRFDILRDTVRMKVGIRSKANYTLHDMAEDTRQLLDVLEMPRAHLVGLSMGGMISQLVAAKHPERVRTLTAIMSSTNHPWLPPPKLRMLRAMFAPLPKNPSREQILERMVNNLTELQGSRYTTPHHERAAFCERAFARSFRPGGIMRQTHAITVTGSIEEFSSQVVAPTQVVHGLSDPLLVPAHGKRIAKLIRGAKRELIEGLGHDLPEAVMPRFAELIAGNAARG